MIDLDDFKTINDAVGHAIGDNILHVLGVRLEQHLRAGDTLARLGGDEFSITVEDGSNREVVVSVARRILEEIRIPINYDEQEFVLDASIGVVYIRGLRSSGSRDHAAQRRHGVARGRRAAASPFVVYTEQCTAAFSSGSNSRVISPARRER